MNAQTTPEIRQLITFLTTDRPEETHRFYEKVLGLDLALAKAHCRIYRVSPGAFVSICSSDAPMPDARRVTISIQTGDVDGWYERIMSHGLETDGKPRWSEAYGIYHFFTWDPSGYSIEFQEFRIDEWDHEG